MKTQIQITQLAAILLSVVTTLAPTLRASAQDVITTVAGGGPNGMHAINANINSPDEVVSDKAGNLYFVGQAQDRVFKISTRWRPHSCCRNWHRGV